MQNKIGYALFYSLFYLSVFLLNAQTSVDQALEVVTNEMTTGGNFQIQLKVKGTDLPTENTLGSATVDITYDNTKLNYVNSSNWAFGFAQGYSRSATDNNIFVRILVTGSGVNENGGGDPPGFDITTTYVSWAQLNFTIANASGTTDLTITPTSNAIGLFENYQNEPNTGVIINQVLSAPVNILNEPLSVTGIKFLNEPPNEFRLYQNYPNPFNPETTIKFELPDIHNNLKKVDLLVFNSLGMKVRTLYSGPLAPAIYEMRWDGRDDNALQLSSGIYFIYFKAGSFTQTRKMLLVR